MGNPTEKNIATVINGFNIFFDHIVQKQNLDLNEFVNFMEPIFKTAGYRDTANFGGGNILILTEVSIGDFIVATPAIREIRRIYPYANIIMVVHPRAVEIAECCPYVNELIMNPQKHESYNLLEFYKANLGGVPRLLKQKFDICFSFSIHPHTPLLMYMSGAKIRISSIDDENMEIFNQSKGLTQYLMKLSTHLFPYNTYGYHRVDRFLSLIENLLCLPIINRKTEVWGTPDDVEFAKKCLNGISEPIYSLNMGGIGHKKHYPPEKYARLLEMILAEEPNATFVILGGGQDDLNSAEIIKTVAPKIYENNVIDLTDKTNFRQSATILGLCNMYIGNDAGTMHAAAAVSCPVLTPNCFPADLPISSNDIPQIWYPYGVPSVIVQPEHALPECKDFHHPFGCMANFPHCITQIEPETIFRGFHILKERIALKINEPLYIH